MVEKPYLAKSNGIEFRNFGHKQGIQVRRRNPCIQSNLDLVTNLVVPKTVTKSRVVTKFIVLDNTYGISNISKSN